MTKSEYNAQWSKRQKAKGLCLSCSRPVNGVSRCVYHQMTQRRNMHNLRTRWKAKIYRHYGNQCACCGELEEKFLSIDHINNDGFKQRQYVNGKRNSWSSYRVYCHILRNNYPTDLQLLCMNCNYGKKQNGGKCPHKTLVPT